MSWTFAPHAPLTLLGQAFSVYPAILQRIFSQCLGPQGRKLREDKYKSHREMRANEFPRW